jgi:nitroimidazol reductase NimA-like FMN-containing flavoprotein (pyridoxamine 5'-phosphate oxidase superfamily)
VNITDSAALEEILRAAPILYLALHAQPAPHVVPVCFGMEDGLLYVHGAAAGTKIDLIRANPSVGFSACTEVTVTAGAAACSSTASARSVVGTGRARIVQDEGERIRGLDAIMRHYQPAHGPVDHSGSGPADPCGRAPSERSQEGSRFTYRSQSLSRTCVIAIHVETLSGKRTGETGEKLPASR